MTNAVPAGYAWYVGTLRDGKITTQLPLVQTSWSDVMDDAGALQGVLVLSDPDVAALNPYVAAEPCRCFLALAYLDSQGHETFIAGGPIWTHSYDGGSKQLTIGAAGLWSYYDHRKVLPVLTSGQNPATITTNFTNSLATIAKQLVQLAHLHTAGSVPVVFPDDIVGTEQRSYPGYEMDDVGQAMRDLTSVDAGPEIQFVPRRREDDGRFIEWVMRTGTPTDPLLHQTGEDWVWDASAARSSLSGIGTVNRDGSIMATRAWAQGAGSDSATLFSEVDDTELTGAGFPLLEVLDSNHSTVSKQLVLDGYAREMSRQSAKPKESWTVTVRRDEEPTVSEYAVGDWVKITLAGDPYLPDATYRMRLLSRSGDDSSDITLSLAPRLDAA